MVPWAGLHRCEPDSGEKRCGGQGVCLVASFLLRLLWPLARGGPVPRCLSLGPV